MLRPGASGTMKKSQAIRSRQTPKQVISIGITTSPVPRSAPESSSMKTNRQYAGATWCNICIPIETTFSSEVNRRNSGVPKL